MTSSPSSTSAPQTDDRSWPARNARALGIGLVVVVAGAVVLSFVLGLFGDSPAKAGSMATVGIMSPAGGDDADGSAVLEAPSLAAGETADGDVVLENVGDSSGAFTLSAGEVTDTPADPAFSEVLTLRVLRDGAEIYSGPLPGFAEQDLGTWQPGEKQHFTFTVTAADTAGTEYADASSELTFTWAAADG
jgi:hypothetical protein